jgi:hypothetical protein
MKCNRYLTAKIMPSALAMLLVWNAGAQTQAGGYVLLPGPSFMVTAGGSLTLQIQHYSESGNVYEGIGNSDEIQAARWMINGNPVPYQDAFEGNLMPKFISATYHAPRNLPPKNPVVISASFHPSDTSRELITLVCNVQVVAPAQQWYVAFTYVESSYRSDHSSTQSTTATHMISGSAAMLIDAPPPDKDGYVSINTGYDSITNYTSSGSWSAMSTEISKDLTGSIREKTVRNSSGHPEGRSGMEFEYDPSPDGIKMLTDAGLVFDQTGNEDYWIRDQNGNMKHTSSAANSNYGTSITLGGNGAVVKKINNGFTINYTKHTDTSYTDISGGIHRLSSSVDYHVTITRSKLLPAHTILFNFKTNGTETAFIKGRQ